MHGDEILIPIIFFLTVGAVLGTYLLTRHKERMNMIEKGMKADDIKSLYMRHAFQTNPLTSLKWGIVLIGVGAAIMLGMYLHRNFVFEEGIYPSLIAIFGGIALVLFYFIAGKRQQQ
jgi:hypothetical protein